MGRLIRPIRVEGGLAYVTLTRGYETVIDKSSLPLVEGYNWYTSVRPRAFYAVRSDHDGQKLKTTLMHRVIMGDPQGLEVDHINSDGLNNRLENLRVVTKEQNQRNQRASYKNACGLKGVSWHKVTQKWQSQITVDRKNFHLGLFDTPEEAHAAYVEASKNMHGEFGRVK